MLGQWGCQGKRNFGTTYVNAVDILGGIDIGTSLSLLASLHNVSLGIAADEARRDGCRVWQSAIRLILTQRNIMPRR